MPRRLTTPEFINRANRKHRGRYDYSPTSYAGALGKVVITCPAHGDFEQRAVDHLDGHGCPQCGRIRQIEAVRKSRAQFIADAQKVHSGRYDYALVLYVNAFTPVRITCPTHGPFEQLPLNHLAGHGCPQCGRSSSQNPHPPTP